MNQNNNKTELDTKQTAIIRRQIQLGRILKTNHPEIASMYSGGKRQPEIVVELALCTEYGINKDLARKALYYALRGHGGGFSEEEYVGLIENNAELDRLNKEHKTFGGRKAFTQSLGAYSLSEEEKRRIRQKGYEHGLGRLTLEKRVEFGRASAAARGDIPWVKEEDSPIEIKCSEKEFAYKLSQDPSFHHDGKGTGRKRGTPNWSLITVKLNEIYHDGKNVRNSSRVQITIIKYKKQKAKNVTP